MPIYEFYCADCHTLFNFFSSRVDTEARPLCPRCKKVRLERRPATFATLKHTGGGEGEEGEEGPFGDMDESRLEGAMESIMGELGDADPNEEDPRQVAHLLRRFSAAAGFEPGPKMEEILARLESGEDPDDLEDSLGDDLDDDEALGELFRLKRAAQAGRRSPKPRVDKELYFL